jgi:hypothetical protein
VLVLCSSGRISRAGLAEKKIAILEQALVHHPGSDELLLALLGAAEAVATPEQLRERWRSILARHSGSARLWRAFLSWRRGHFSSFTCSSIRNAYGDAIVVRAPLPAVHIVSCSALLFLIASQSVCGCIAAWPHHAGQGICGACTRL